MSAAEMLAGAAPERAPDWHSIPWKKVWRTVRRLQARIVKMQEDLATQTVEASAGGGAVTVTISEIGMGPAQARVQRVKISPEAVDPEDIETLEDLVVAAVNEALSKAQKTAADKLGPLTGGMKLPGMP